MIKSSKFQILKWNNYYHQLPILIKFSKFSSRDNDKCSDIASKLSFIDMLRKFERAQHFKQDMAWRCHNLRTQIYSYPCHTDVWRSCACYWQLVFLWTRRSCRHPGVGCTSSFPSILCKVQIQSMINCYTPTKEIRTLQIQVNLYSVDRELHFMTS